MHRHSVVLVFAIALVACSFGDSAIERKGTAAVRNLFKDPDSALFRNAYVNGQAYCGEVNSKNSFGGYVGYARFIVAQDIALLESNNDSDFRENWNIFCLRGAEKVAYEAKEKEFARQLEETRQAVLKMNAETDREREKQNHEANSGK